MSLVDLVAGKRPGWGGMPRTVATVASAATGNRPNNRPKSATVATVATVAVGHAAKTTIQGHIYHNNNKETLSLSCARARKNTVSATATVATPATHEPTSLARSESKNERAATATPATPATHAAPDETKATPRAWLIRHPDGQLFSHTFTPPATLAEVRALHPDALGIEPEEGETWQAAEQPDHDPPQLGPPDDRITCRACCHLSGARCQAAQRGAFNHRARWYEPDPEARHACFLFAPLPHDPDPRAGATRWPSLAWMMRAPT